jgi:crotonobetainyl-CoA:carnitine CoA-transferase CaiB-like acyl-CoA transferase
MLLGDLGADVVKVERPGDGDETRTWGPPFAEDGQSAYFRSINRNKLSIALDLDSPADAAVVRELGAGADVIVDNFRPGTLERRGIDFGASGASRGSVWCTITGFGPNSARPGYDFVVQAECGWMAITGDRDGDPTKTGVALADLIAGKDAAVAILAALVATRGGSGGSRRVFISLADSARAALVNVAQNTLITGKDAQRWGNAHPNLVPYQLFHTADEPIVVAVGSDAQWTKCARALGLDDLADAPDLRENAGRVVQRDRVVSAFAARLRTAPASEWQRRLGDAGVPTGRVRSIIDVVRDVDASAVTGMPSPVGGVARFAPPALDEHGAVLRDVGWNAFSGR